MAIKAELKDSIYVVNITDGGKYVPCIPYESQSTSTVLKNGKLVKFVETKEFGFGNVFYILEIIDSGDTVLVAPSCIHFFQRILSKYRFR